MLLSPLAVPFQPSSEFFFDNSEFVIYNDGMPSMVCANGRGDIIGGISEEALDLMFPPSAQDVAEMEACDIFVEFLAVLSLMEDQEELARKQFGHIPKRWEARRREGLVKAKYARGSVVKKNHTLPTDEKIKAVVPMSNFCRRHTSSFGRNHPNAVKKNHSMSRNMNFGRRSKPIHQPRKFS